MIYHSLGQLGVKHHVDFSTVRSVALEEGITPSLTLDYVEYVSEHDAKRLLDALVRRRLVFPFPAVPIEIKT